MNRALLLALCFSLCSLAVAQEPKPSGPTSPPPITKATIATKDSTPTGQRSLTYVQRRELGMIFGNFRAAEAELRQELKITDSTSDSESAVLILAKIRRANRKSFDAGGYDWEACLAFVEIWYSELRDEK